MQCLIENYPMVLEKKKCGEFINRRTCRRTDRQTDGRKTGVQNRVKTTLLTEKFVSTVEREFLLCKE